MARVTPLLQSTQSECGLVCAAMVLNAYGTNVSVPELRKLTPVGRDGLSLKKLRDIFLKFNYQVRVLKVVRDAPIEKLGLPSLLLWNNNHYVVLKRVQRKRVTIVDPAYGTLTLKREDFWEHASGVVLVAAPTADTPKFKKKNKAEYKLFTSLLRGHIKTIITLLAATIFAIGIGLVPPAFSAFVMDNYFRKPDIYDSGTVAAFIGLLALCYCCNLLAKTFASIALERSLDYGLSAHVFMHLVRLPFSYFYGRPTGDLLLRFSSISNIRDAVTSRILPLFLNSFSVICYLAIIFHISPLYGATLLCLIFVVTALVVSFAHIGRRLSDEEIQARSTTQSLTVDVLSGIENSKAMGLEGLLSSTYSAALRREVLASAKRNQADALLGASISTLTFIAPLILLTVGFHEFAGGNLSLGSVIGLSALATSALSPVASMATDFNIILMTRVHVGRLVDILGEKVEHQHAGALSIPDAGINRISFEDVRFKFEGSETEVIAGASFSVSRGDRIIIAGPTGAGKSTIGRILCLLLTPTGGKVTIDGVDIAAIDKTSVRRRIGVVVQGAPASQGTIETNLRMGDESLSETDLWEALRIAELDEDIRSMQLGLSTPLGERGIGLSGGQIQRLMLARALVRKPSLLLLDEATANIDPMTERNILRNIEQLQITCVIITHRLSTIREATKVLFVKSGRVLGFAAPDSLCEQVPEVRAFLEVEG